MDKETIISTLKRLASEESYREPGRLGVTTRYRILGIPKPRLRGIARKNGVNHALALELWETDIHEAKILTCMIADPSKTTSSLMDAWVSEIDNWELCDQCVINLFWKTRYAYSKIEEWCRDGREYVRRAGLALIARLALKDKDASDKVFEDLLPLIELGAYDDRKPVWKAASWALRQIGKRNLVLSNKAINMAERLLTGDSRIAMRVVREVLKELESERIRKKLR